MIPKFTSMSELTGFLKALPVDANYANMLADDFNMIAPEDAEQHTKEYFFKYLAQGQHLGKSGQELIDYATIKVNKFKVDFPWTLNKYEPKEGSTGSTKTSAPKGDRGLRTRVVQPKQADGTVLFLEHRQVFVGYFDGKIQCTKKTAEACTEYLNAKFN